MNNLLYIVLFVIALFALMQIYVRLSTWLKKGRKVENIDGELGKEINSGGRHLLYFYTSSCAACKTMMPLIDALKEEFKNIHKVNLAIDMEIGREFGVMGTPATVVVENNKITSYTLGHKNTPFLRNLLDN